MKKYVRFLLALLLISVLTIPALAEGGYADVESSDSVTDLADLLTDEEEEALRTHIATIWDTYDFDVAILTVEDTGDKSIQDYAYDYYTYNGFGAGEDADGLVFLQSTAERDYYTCAKGYGEYAFTPYGIDQMSDSFVPYLSDGEYYDAYESYLNTVEQYLDLAAEGTPVEDTPMSSLTFWLLSFVVGLILAFIIVHIMKKSMNTAVEQTHATEYIKNGSFHLSEQSDLYLYTTMTVTARPKANDSDSGHFTGSDGGSYSGGGGKY